MERIHLTSLGPISEADITFGDMTVFVGEQASGKSLMLQLVKLILDAEPIVRTLKTHGFDWHKKPAEFLYLYFGEGMESTWSDATQVAVDEQEFALERVFARKSRRKAESVCLIPAQRVVTLKDGWPRCFTDYASGAPYAVKRFSEQLRLLLDMDFGRGDRLIFPQSRFLNQTIRNAVGESVFGRAQVKLDREGLRKRIVLDVAGNCLPFMAWSSGQREFTPLLMGLYSLMPARGEARKNQRNWVVIEEPEAGLHPKAVSALLLLLLELLKRGYRIVVSTHASQIVELIWAIQFLAEGSAGPKWLLKLLGLKPDPGSKKLAETVFEKTFKTYYFSPADEAVPVKDISTLDPDDTDDAVSDWGGLTLFSTRVADILTSAIWEGEL